MADPAARHQSSKEDLRKGSLEDYASVMPRGDEAPTTGGGARTVGGTDRSPGARPAPRALRDPRELRALAHPLRLEILELLVRHGPLTATEVAEHVQTESPANCSWHLRQLARYGYVEEAGTGPGRQRRWRLVPHSTTVEAIGDETAELARAVDAFQDVLLEREVAALREWQAHRRQDDPQWREASFNMHSHGWATAEEMAAFQAEFMDLFARHPLSDPGRIDPANRPPDARPVRLVAWLIPHPAAGPPDRTDAAGGTGSDIERTNRRDR